MPFNVSLLMSRAQFKWFVGICTVCVVILFTLMFVFPVRLDSINLTIMRGLIADRMPGDGGGGVKQPVEALFPQKMGDSGLASGPLFVHPTNPRYFTDGSGRAVYLTGTHTWANFQNSGASDPPVTFDYAGYLDFLEARNHNFFRLWAWEQAKWGGWYAGDMYFSPLAYERSGPGTASDGKAKFDLTRFNQTYFDRLRERVIQAGDKGIYVSIMLFDGWSIEDKDYGGWNPWPGHPYHGDNNINGIDGDPNNDGEGREIHTLQMQSVIELQEAYVRKVIDTVNDLDNVLYEISNESDGGATEWQYHMINYIKAYEATKPKQHPVGMTVEWPGGSNADLFNSPADWVSPNDYAEPPEADGSKVIISDTDHIWGIGGDREWVWKSFVRGMNPIFMDPYNCSPVWPPDNCNADDPTWVSLRLNMGFTRTYAERMDLAAMTPRSDLCSTGYCLANPAAANAEYLVYAPNGGFFTVDLSATTGTLSAEWFTPETGESAKDGTITGGETRSFTAPFGGDAVLYLYQTTADNDPPVISNISVFALATKANITWATDEAATGQVKYGLNSSLPMSTAKTADLVVSHRAWLTDLTSETTYFYQIYSEDAQGNEAMSEVLNFTTIATADVGEIYMPIVGYDQISTNARVSSCPYQR